MVNFANTDKVYRYSPLPLQPNLAALKKLSTSAFDEAEITVYDSETIIAWIVLWEFQVLRHV